MNRSPRLELALLGPFRATLDGVPITAFRADSTRGLLAYLAMHPGIVFRRETLATLLWSEHDQESSLVNLRQILAILRRALDDGGTQHFMEITPRTVCFEPNSAVWVDVAHFRELASAEPRLHTADCCSETELDSFRQALALYRGDMLSDLHIPGPAYDEWLMREREHLHQSAVDLLHSIANYYEHRDDPEKIKYYATRQLELEPWSEEAYRQLMVAYARLGQRSAALKQYALCQRALFGAFGVEPGEKTKSLYRKIARDTLPVRQVSEI